MVRFHGLQYGRGIDDNLVASLISSLSLFSGVGISYLMGIVLDLDVEGIAGSFTFTYGAAAFLLAIRAIYLNKTTLVDNPQPCSHYLSQFRSWSPSIFQTCLPSSINNVTPDNSSNPSNEEESVDENNNDSDEINHTI